jgi:hypothetical protein
MSEGAALRNSTFKILIPGQIVNFPLDAIGSFPVCSTHDFDARGCPHEHFQSDELVVVLGIARTMHA